MGKNATSPTDVEEITRKIEAGEVHVKNKATKATKKKARTVKGVNGKISDAEIMAWLREQDGAVTSTQVRDGLAFKTRTQARRVLRRLAKAKKVKIGQRKISDKRQLFTFIVA